MPPVSPEVNHRCVCDKPEGKSAPDKALSTSRHSHRSSADCPGGLSSVGDDREGICRGCGVAPGPVPHARSGES